MDLVKLFFKQKSKENQKSFCLEQRIIIHLFSCMHNYARKVNHIHTESYFSSLDVGMHLFYIIIFLFITSTKVNMMISFKH